MTYLELVNAVLVRMREDEILTVQGSDDVVVGMVKEFVNDAKETVEQAHTWTGLSAEWTESTSDVSDKVVLTNSSVSVIIDDVYLDNGVELREVDKSYLRKRALQGSNSNDPRYYIVDGLDASNNVQLRLWPAPETVQPVYIYGYQSTARMSQDSDVLRVPAQPVIYLAQAMASRERGEDGSLQASELLGLAKQYLSDAIAQDATNSDAENIWTQV